MPFLFQHGGKAEKLQQILNTLVAREESLRFTSHPRLVLESIMIRLCQMGDLVALDELIRKLESLEKKLSAPGHPQGGIQVSDQPGPWQVENKEEKPSPRPIKKEDWSAFLKFIGSKNKSMASVLEGFPFLEGSEESVVLGRSPKPFDVSYLDESDRGDKLKAYGLEFFKREVAIRVSKETREPESPPLKQAPKGSAHPKGVQDVLNMFQGEIRGEVTEDQRRKES